MTLGEKIRFLRERSNLKQKELADILKIAQQTLSHYEKGRIPPDTEMCKKIAAFFKISLDDLLDDGDGYFHLVPAPGQASDEMNKKFEGYDPELINYAMVKIKQAISGLSPEEAKQKVKQMILTLKVMEEIENGNKKSD
jgi:transcriptional regulator with XRE-family HTH domain